MIFHIAGAALVAVGCVGILATLWERLAGQGHTTVGVYTRLIFVWGCWATLVITSGDTLGAALFCGFLLGWPMWWTLRCLVRHTITGGAQ